MSFPPPVRVRSRRAAHSGQGGLCAVSTAPDPSGPQVSPRPRAQLPGAGGERVGSPRQPFPSRRGLRSRPEPPGPAPAPGPGPAPLRQHLVPNRSAHAWPLCPRVLEWAPSICRLALPASPASSCPRPGGRLPCCFEAPHCFQAQHQPAHTTRPQKSVPGAPRPPTVTPHWLCARTAVRTGRGRTSPAGPLVRSREGAHLGCRPAHLRSPGQLSLGSVPGPRGRDS